MKEKILKALDILIPCATVICVVTASLYIYNVRKNYAAAENEYTELEEYVVSDDSMDAFLNEEAEIAELSEREGAGSGAPGKSNQSETAQDKAEAEKTDSEQNKVEDDVDSVVATNNTTDETVSDIDAADGESMPEQAPTSTDATSTPESNQSETEPTETNSTQSAPSFLDTIQNTPTPAQSTDNTTDAEYIPQQKSESSGGFFSKVRDFFGFITSGFSKAETTLEEQANNYKSTLPQLNLPKPPANKDKSKASTAPAEPTEPKKKAPTFRKIDVDFESLESINPDVVGWIVIPKISLSYPVLQGEDNDHYLHYTFKNEKNSAGAIFLDSMVNADMSSCNTFVYGHNMKNKTMFGSLKLFNGNDELLKNAYIYYYTKDHAYKYRVFANYITKAGSVTYHLSDDKDQLDFYLEKIAQINKYEEGKEMDLTDVERIITLSTCSGVNTGQRTVIQAYLDDDYEY